jgi:Xaa-Pro aminopeptidase
MLGGPEPELEDTNAMARRAPSATTRSRIKRCRQAMARKKLPALLITNRHDHYYLIGFSGEDSAILITRDAVHIISDGRFETSIKQEAPWAKVALRKGLLNDEIVSVIRSYRLRTVGVQAEVMPVADRDELRKKLKGVKIVEAPPIVSDMRCIKSDEEVALIEKSLRLCEAAYKATLKTIRVGQTELELAGRLEYEMKRRGSLTPAFDSIVGIDANAALPHAFPGQRKVKKGCLILFDWGATLDFYTSDLTRTVFIGSIPPKMKRVYEVVLEAQRRAIKAIKPGARMCDVDAVARQHIADAGYAKEFNHGLGHGMGLDVHESPSLSWRSAQKLEPGMVVTVEPGVYLPGLGGVRIEDDVLVTSTGTRVLSRLKKDIRSAVLAV